MALLVEKVKGSKTKFVVELRLDNPKIRDYMGYVEKRDGGMYAALPNEYPESLHEDYEEAVTEVQKRGKCLPIRGRD